MYLFIYLFIYFELEILSKLMILCSKELDFITTAKHVYLRKTMNYWNSAYSLFAGANWNIMKDFPLNRIMELLLGKYESSIISFCKTKTKLMKIKAVFL